MRWANKIKGDNAESSFRAYAESLGYKVTQTPLEIDRKEHVDFYLTDSNGGTMCVDVKSCKRIAGEKRDDLVWVEVQSEQPNNKPWLFAPLMSHVVFEQVDGSFLIVPRLHLLKTIRETYNEATIITDDIKTLLSEPKRYCYRRSHMKREKCLLVETRLLKPFAVDLGSKQHKITDYFIPNTKKSL